MMLTRGLRWALAASLLLFATISSSYRIYAEEFPSRYIKLIVPYAAGGPTDINARLLAPSIGEALGQNVVVENRGGAGTIVGTNVVANAAPDGYTLLYADLGLAVSHLIGDAPYDPQKAFVPVAMVGRSWLVLTANPNVPVKSVAELLALAKQKPDQLHFASGGLGSPPHLAGIALNKAANINLVHVAYRGSGPALVDVLGGQIEFLFLGPTASGPYIKSGQLRALAVTGKERLKLLPDVPTFVESGISLGAIDNGTWFGIVAPAGTPPDVVAKLNSAVNKALREPNVRENFEKNNIVTAGGTPEEFGALLNSQWTYWKDALAGQKQQMKE